MNWVLRPKENKTEDLLKIKIFYVLKYIQACCTKERNNLLPIVTKKNSRLKLLQRILKICIITILRVTMQSLWVLQCCGVSKHGSIRKGASTYDAALGQWTDWSQKSLYSLRSCPVKLDSYLS